LLTRRRLVLDTHVWLDWLVFDDPGIARIRNAVGLKRAEIFIDAVCEAELARVLAYDLHKRKLDAAAQAACIAQCRRLSHRIDATLPESQRAGLPRCRDPDDQKFLEAALVARADFLITKDRALLHLARRRARSLPFRIVTPLSLEINKEYTF
jgi:uncharacterized protein